MMRTAEMTTVRLARMLAGFGIVMARAGAKVAKRVHDAAREDAAISYREATHKFTALLQQSETGEHRATEEELLTYWLMLMDDYGREAYTTARVRLSVAHGVTMVPTKVAHAAKAYSAARVSKVGGFPLAAAKKATQAAAETRSKQPSTAFNKRPGAKIAERQKAMISRAISKVVSKDAKRVEETESQAAYGTAQSAVLADAGFKFKIWNTCDDEKVRASHRLCEEQGAIPHAVPFANGLMYPGDPNGSAAEVCNCRCWLTGEGRL